MERRSFSLSQIQAYLFCPLKYRFQYLDKLPRPWRPSALAFGSSVHSALEWFHKQRLLGKSPKLAEVVEIFEADWYAQNLEPVVFSEKESQDSLVEKGREMLRLYVEAANGAPLAQKHGDPGRGFPV